MTSANIPRYQLYFPYVDNVWTFDNKRLNKKAQVSYYDCRLFKRRPSSSRSSDLPPDVKRRKTKARESGLCRVKIKIEEFAPGATPEWPNGIVRITRITDEGHRHALDQSDQLKRNSVVRGIARAQMEKGMPPAEILAMMKGAKSMEGSRHLDAAGGKHLTRQDVINAGMAKGLAKADQRKEPVRKTFRESVDLAHRELQAKGWITHLITGKEGDEELVVGLLFGQRERVTTLLQRGFLTLLDFADTIPLPAPGVLYTFMVRSSTGDFVPGAHVLLDSYANSPTNALASSICALQSWAASPWKVRYLLTRESLLFREVSKQAFPPPNAQFTTTHILCTSHSESNLHSTLTSAPNARARMFAAMYQHRNREEAVACVDEAVAEASDLKMKRQLKEWRENIDSWALFARHEAAVLLQVRDLSPLEDFHIRVAESAKRDLAQQQQQQQITPTPLNAGHPPTATPTPRAPILVILDALLATRYPDPFPPVPPHPPLPQRTLSTVLPVQLFPPFLQPLLLSTLNSALISIRNGEPQFLASESGCNCLWARAWRLPCRHLLAHEYARGNIVRWQEVADLFRGWEGWEGWENVRAGELSDWAKRVDTAVV